MEPLVRIRKKTGIIPHSVIDGLVDLHAAVDPDTGHFVCHYYTVRLALVELGSESFPGLSVGDNITVLLGEEPARIVEEKGERVDLGDLLSGNVVSVDRGSLALISGLLRYSGGSVRAYRIDKRFTSVVVRSNSEEPVTIIVSESRKKVRNEAVLTV